MRWAGTHSVFFETRWEIQGYRSQVSRVLDVVMVDVILKSGRVALVCSLFGFQVLYNGLAQFRLYITV